MSRPKNSPLELSKSYASLHELLRGGLKAVDPQAAILSSPMTESSGDLIRRTHDNLSADFTEKTEINFKIEVKTSEIELIKKILDDYAKAMSSENQEIKNICIEKLSNLMKQQAYGNALAKRGVSLRFKGKKYHEADIKEMLDKYLHETAQESNEIISQVRVAYQQLNELTSDVSLMHASMLTIRKSMRKANLLALHTQIETSVTDNQPIIPEAFTQIQEITRMVSDQLYEVNDCLVQVTEDMCSISQALRPLTQTSQPAFERLYLGVHQLMEGVLKQYQQIKQLFTEQSQEVTATTASIEHALLLLNQSTKRQCDQLKTVTEVIDSWISGDASQAVNPLQLHEVINQLGRILKNKEETSLMEDNFQEVTLT